MSNSIIIMMMMIIIIIIIIIVIIIIIILIIIIIIIIITLSTPRALQIQKILVTFLPLLLPPGPRTYYCPLCNILILKIILSFQNLKFVNIF